MKNFHENITSKVGKCLAFKAIITVGPMKLMYKLNSKNKYHIYILNFMNEKKRFHIFNMG